MRGRSRFTLTNRLLALSALIVFATTALLVVTTAAGVYRMAGQQVAARQSAYRQVVIAGISGRLTGALGVVRTTAEQAGIKGDDPAEYRRVLSTSGLENAQYLHGMALLAEDGTLLYEWPSGIAADVPAGPDGDGPFVYRQADGGATRGALWIDAPVTSQDGSTRMLWARVRTDFITNDLADVALSPGSPIALVFDADGTPLFVGGDVERITGGRFVFEPGENGSTSGVLRVEGDAEEVGFYGEVTSPEGLGWRVGVVEPATRVMRDTWRALGPGALGWALALLFATGASLYVVSRVTRPLRQLERRARALASGARPQPETVEQYDEVDRLLDAVDSIGRRLERVSGIAELLARSTDLAQVLEGVTTAIAHMLGVEDVDVLLLTEDGQLEVVAAGSVASGPDARIAVHEVPWIAQAIAEGVPVAAAAGSDDALRRMHEALDAAACATPLRAGDDIIGAVAVLRRDGRAFTPDELETVRSFAAQASVALRNSRLFEQERRSRIDAVSLNEIAERITSPLGVEETLTAVAAMSAELLGYDAGLVVLTDRAAYGLPATEPSALERRMVEIWESGHGDDEQGPLPVALAEGAGAPRLDDGRAASAALIVPVRRGGAVAGLLVCLSAASRPAAGERMLALADTVGKQLSLALENASLYEETRSRADNLETIFRISHAVASSLQSRVVLNRVLDVVQKILAADAVMLMTYDSARKTMTVPMARGILHRDMLEATFRPGEDVPGRVYETLEPERYDRIASADTRLLNAAAAQGLASMLAVPLLARGKSIGVLAVFSRAEAAFSTDELDLLRTFASQAALAIDTAEMFSREHHVAAVLQESILPAQLPRIDGIDAASVYLPAGEHAEIGGDYYDLFEGPDGRVVMSIGDVCGKGVEAATKTSMIKYAIRGMVVAGLGPARVLEELNRMLVASGDPTSIVTLWIGYLDRRACEIVYADGGHPPGLLLRDGGHRVERLATTGALLGAVADASWSEHAVPVSPGSTILLYTDGVTEARNGAKFFGEGRVRRALRADGSAAELADRLISSVRRFSAGELRDDAAILTVRLLCLGDDAAPVTSTSESGM